MWMFQTIPLKSQHVLNTACILDVVLLDVLYMYVHSINFVNVYYQNVMKMTHFGDAMCSHVFGPSSDKEISCTK